MELKPGYKQTEVGVIPEDWDVKAVDELAKVTSGKRMPLGSSLTDRPNAHPYIRISDMVPGSVRTSELMYVPDSIFPAIKRFRIYSQDIFISVAGTLGIVGKVPNALSGANLTENADRITDITCSQDYLLYFLMSPQVQGSIDAIRTVGAQPKLALSRIRKFKIALPQSHDEQNQIADCLREVDNLLAALDQLITKKRLIKQAAMQELLTGKRRLPGFEEEWEAKRLGELGDFLKGSGVKKDEAASGDLPCVRYGEIYTHHENYVSEFRSYISEAVSSRATAIRQGDILFAGSGETKEEIGKTVALQHPVKAFAGGDIVILRQSSNDALFLGYRLNANDVSRQKAGLGQGDAVVHISAHALSKIGVSLPGKAEQEAIAGILYEMDTELSQLQLRLAKTQELKQGMMQQLLTGKIRLT